MVYVLIFSMLLQPCSFLGTLFYPCLFLGLLKQIDAGGDVFVAGVSMNGGIYCLSRPAAVSVNNASTLSWVNIAGSLKYYSCGLWGCWGVNSADDIYFRFAVTPDSCAGSRWQNIPGKLSMIEVGTEGSVYGVNSAGQIYRRYRKGEDRREDFSHE